MQSILQRYFLNGSLRIQEFSCCCSSSLAAVARSRLGSGQSWRKSHRRFQEIRDRHGETLSTLDRQSASFNETIRILGGSHSYFRGRHWSPRARADSSYSERPRGCQWSHERRGPAGLGNCGNDPSPTSRICDWALGRSVDTRQIHIRLAAPTPPG